MNTYKEWSADPNKLRQVAQNQVRLGNKVIQWLAFDQENNMFYTEWAIPYTGKQFDFHLGYKK